jgi:hypothetical protein
MSQPDREATWKMSFDCFQTVRRSGATAIESLSALEDINLKNHGGENLLHEAIAFVMTKLHIG